MIIDCISDLHGYYPKLEGGDLLIVAGDLTSDDSSEAWCKFETWITDLNYHIKIIVGGNHDNFLQSVPAHNMWKYWDKVDARLHYLCDSGTEFEGLNIWGSPWTAQFSGINPKCCAFTVPDSHHTDKDLEKYWDKIPWDTDILITHSPPSGIFDAVLRESKWGNHTDCVGSVSLRNHVMDRVKPQLHVFGHIHEWGGRVLDTCITKFVNASHVNECYGPVNKPIRIEL